LCEYLWRFPGEGRQTTVGLSTTAIFSVFAGCFSDTLEMRPALLYGDMQSVVGFSVMPKCMTLNALTGYFALNSALAPVCLSQTARLSKNNCMKNNNDKHIRYCQWHKSSAGTLVSGNVRFVRIFRQVL